MKIEWTNQAKLGGVLLVGVLAMYGSEKPDNVVPPPPPTVESCSSGCFSTTEHESIRNGVLIQNNCDSEMNVMFCVAPEGQGSPECDSPNTPAVDPWDDNPNDAPLATLKGQEATVLVCGCKTPQIVDPASDPFDGNGTCVDP